MKFLLIFLKTVISAIVLWIAYLFISVYLDALIGELKCTEEPCLEYYLNTKPKMQMIIYTSFSSSPTGESDIINIIRDFNYLKEYKSDYVIPIPKETKNNGTLWMYVMMGANDDSENWDEWEPPSPETGVNLQVSLSEYLLPKGDNSKLNRKMANNIKGSHNKKEKILKPITHLYKNVYVTLITEEFSLSKNDIPFEFKDYLKINNKNEILPALQTNFLKTRSSDLVEMDPNMNNFTLTFNYNPIGVTSQRIILYGFNSLRALKYINNMDQIKALFTDTDVKILVLAVSVYLLCIVFEILAFKSDISFWKGSKTYAGLSVNAIILRSFGTVIHVLYLIDQIAYFSTVPLICASIAAIIELWKCKKILKIEFTTCGIRRRQDDQTLEVAKAEKDIHDLDKEAMHYLSHFLFPLLLGGTTYFLLHSTYTSWYSRIIASLSKAIYTFGILFMFPQLYINYKLKSVAALPWNSLRYRAFNAFIENIWFLILPVPTGLKIVCFGDDIIFIILLYQRWLYPINKTPINTNLANDDAIQEDSNNQQMEQMQEIKDN